MATPDSPRPSPSAQRDHLANIRTFLAWVRTGITITGIGFVVARFGLLLNELPGHAHPHSVRGSAILGAIMAFVGGAFIVFAALDFFATRRAIDTGTVRFRPELYLLLASTLVVVAIVLGVYILVS